MKKVLIATALGATLFALSAGAAFADTVVYDAIPSTLAPNYVSEAFQATQTNEFGDYVHLAGTARLLSTVSFTMSDWAVASSPDNVAFCAASAGNCDSTGFNWPITVNVYSNHLGANGAPDTLLATKTVTQHIAWRPESPVCPTDSTAWLASDNNCYHGFATNITFDMSSLGVTLPNDVIVTLAFNTETYGAQPVGVDGPYDSLNVAVPDNDPVTVGTDDSATEVFWNTDTVGWYSNKSCTGGTLCEDTNWTDGAATDGTVAMEITANAPSVTTNSATAETTSAATLNGTDGPVNADDTSFWWGTTVPTTPITTPGSNPAATSEFPAGWSHDSGEGAATAGASFSENLTGLTAGETYYFVAWVEVGGIWYPGQTLSFVVPLAAGSCPAGTTQSKTPLETVSVNSDLDTPTPSTHTLSNGTKYVLVASGTWQNGGLNAVDPMYASLTSWTTYQEGYDTTPYFLGPEEFNLELNGAFTDWGPYSTGHSYTYLYTGTGAKANFLVFDGNSNNGVSGINDSWYGDNVGTLSVAIYQCTKPSTSTVTVTNNNTSTVTVTTTSSSNSGGNIVVGSSNGGSGGKGGSTTIVTGPSISSSKSVTIVNTNITSIGKKH